MDVGSVIFLSTQQSDRQDHRDRHFLSIDEIAVISPGSHFTAKPCFVLHWTPITLLPSSWVFYSLRLSRSSHSTSTPP